MHKQDRLQILRKPEWLKIKIGHGSEFREVQEQIRSNGLNTICTSGDCPNKYECWSRGTATIMILGNICTRHCKFCNVDPGRPLPPDPNEHIKVANSIRALKLKHCVLTSVDRDDLPDFGAGHWAKTITEIKLRNPDITIEGLIPDFNGHNDFTQIVIDAEPNVISHNLETTRSLTPKLRSKAKYDTSLNVLSYIANSKIIAKSGIMVGVGETEEEVFQTMDDLLNVGVKVMTIGQYLQPTLSHYPVIEYVHPDQFAKYKEIGLQKGFQYIESGPLVRSSYFAENHINVKLK
ncbi:MAG: lipoyl synthase [Ignavibacteria bacterium GWF2_33_9]|nr:MAG: lipoyl synthase [Ignavibacteria bacterium GWF2_33_9]